MDYQEIADILTEAAEKAKPTKQMAANNGITLEDAYSIQQQCVKSRMANGEYITGYKLGFTNRAKMEKMGVHDLIWGILTNKMQVLNDEKVNTEKWINQHAEPEIAFRVAKDITESVGLKDITDYIDKMAPAIEIVDSRYENFEFSLEDMVADNCSASAYVIGDWINISEEIDNLNIQLKIDDEVQQEGNSSAILANPLQSVVELSRLASKAETVIKKGQIVLAGAATQAVAFSANQSIEVEIEQLGKVSFKTK